MDAHDQKLFDTFAEPWVREWIMCGDPLKAMCVQMPTDVGTAMRLAWQWQQLPEVMEIRSRVLGDEGNGAFLPTKAEFAKKVLAKAEQCANPEVAFKGLELAAKIMGFIEKPHSGATVNIQNNKVMLVKNYGDDDEWERGAARQQKRLAHA